ncbi:hypothetical protein [Streptomyces sp. NPDC052727]|uniref:hypothetical protein n=1 Tax=unclassified Streptomyces TaxID=2593676 RepID=UPI0034216DAB
MKPLLPGVVLAALTVTALAGCTAGTADAGSPAPSPSAARDADTDGTMPSGCPTGSPPPLPKDFPADLPVPDGAVVTSVEHRSGGRLVVATVVRGGFDVALAFMQQRLPKAGYTLKEGEVEEDDAESDFSSPTVEGRWTLRKMPDCEGGVYLTYLTAATS